MTTSFIKSLGIVVVFFATATIASCTKTCDTGYEGKRCDVPVRDKFLGIWNATDNPGNLMYQDTISEGTNILDVIISRNFHTDTFHRVVRATVDGNSITIASQRPNSSKFLLVDGSGIVNNDHTSISWSYNLTDTSQTPPVITNYTGVWTK